MASMTPCLNPTVCGAQNHQIGSDSALRCKSLNGKKDKKGKKAKSNLALVPTAVGPDSPSANLSLFYSEITEDTLPGLSKALKASQGRIGTFLESTTRFLDRGEQVQPGSEYDKYLTAFATNDRVIEVLARSEEMTHSEVREMLKETHELLVAKPEDEVPDELGFTPSDRAKITEQVSEMVKIREQLAVLQAREEEIKNEFRADERLAGNGLLQFGPALVRVKPPAPTWTPSIAPDDLLSKKERKKITISVPDEFVPEQTVVTPAHTVPGYDYIDQELARRVLPSEKYEQLLTRKTPAVELKAL